LGKQEYLTVRTLRPTHLEVNQSGVELASRMNTNNRGAKIVDRMREYCELWMTNNGSRSLAMTVRLLDKPGKVIGTHESKGAFRGP
jgi:hypothetical protein